MGTLADDSSLNLVQWPGDTPSNHDSLLLPPLSSASTTSFSTSSTSSCSSENQSVLVPIEVIRGEGFVLCRGCGNMVATGITCPSCYVEDIMSNQSTSMMISTASSSSVSSATSSSHVSLPLEAARGRNSPHRKKKKAKSSIHQRRGNHFQDASKHVLGQIQRMLPWMSPAIFENDTILGNENASASPGILFSSSSSSSSSSSASPQKVVFDTPLSSRASSSLKSLADGTKHLDAFGQDDMDDDMDDLALTCTHRPQFSRTSKSTHSNADHISTRGAIKVHIQSKNRKRHYKNKAAVNQNCVKKRMIKYPSMTTDDANENQISMNLGQNIQTPLPDQAESVDKDSKISNLATNSKSPRTTTERSPEDIQTTLMSLPTPSMVHSPRNTKLMEGAPEDVFSVGDECYGIENGQCLPCKILRKDGNRCFIHWKGWNSRYCV